jgi:hypothetical protein
LDKDNGGILELYTVETGNTIKNTQTSENLGILPEGDYKLSMTATNSNLSINTRSNTVEFTVGGSNESANVMPDYGLDLGTDSMQAIIFWTFIGIFILVGLLIMVGRMY